MILSYFPNVLLKESLKQSLKHLSSDMHNTHPLVLEDLVASTDPSSDIAPM